MKSKKTLFYQMFVSVENILQAKNEFCKILFQPMNNTFIQHARTYSLAFWIALYTAMQPGVLVETGNRIYDGSIISCKRGVNS